MSLFGFEAPALTDYTGAAEATAAGNAQANNAATQANRPNQYTPWGSTTWSQDANGNWTQNTALNPWMQQQFNAQGQTDATLAQQGANMAGQVAGAYGQPLNTSGMTGMFQLGNPSQLNPSWNSTKEIQQAMLSRLQPDMDSQRNAEIARLKAQGLTEGSDAWNAAVNNMGRQQNDLSMQALLAGSSEANQQFQNQLAANAQNWGQQTDKAGITGQQRQQQLNEAMTLRQLPMQELMQLRGQNVQMPTMPGFATAGATSGPNYLGAAELNSRQNLQNANINNANLSNTYGGLFDLAKMGWDIYSNW